MRLERYGGLLFSWTPTRVRDSSGLRFEVGNIGTKTGATDGSNRPQKGDPKVPLGDVFTRVTALLGRWQMIAAQRSFNGRMGPRSNVTLQRHPPS